MPDLQHNYHDDDFFNAETHHEESDVNVSALLKFLVAFIVLAAVMHIALWVMFKQLAKMERHKQEAPLTAIPQPHTANVPVPRLQPFPTQVTQTQINAPYTNTPETDMTEMRNEQDSYLHSYGWVDRQKGLVHIPIETAKTLALQRGVFKPVAATAPATAPAQPPATQTVPNPAGNKPS